MSSSQVYTEIAHRAVLETDDDALLVFFSGERPPLDNGMAFGPHNAARNIGFVKVARDMADTGVKSSGPSETGGFFDFGGMWTPQKNLGVQWLTNFESLEDNASRLKAVPLPGGQVLLIYELWTGSAYVSTHLMTVNHDGEVIHTRIYIHTHTLRQTDTPKRARVTSMTRNSVISLCVEHRTSAGDSGISCLAFPLPHALLR